MTRPAIDWRSLAGSLPLATAAASLQQAMKAVAGEQRRQALDRLTETSGG